MQTVKARLETRLQADDGLGLVEIMVAITILGVVLSALAATLISSMVAMQKDELRVRATHLANEEVEKLRAIEWDALGFYANDTGYTATFESKDTVTLGTTRPSDAIAPVPLPDPAPVVDGITYAVTRNIVWIDDPADGTGSADSDPQDYKQVHVEVAWDERGETRTIESTSTRVPTLEEVPLEEASAAPATLTIVEEPDIRPSTVLIRESGDTASDITINLTTTHPANTVTFSVEGEDGTEIDQRQLESVNGTEPATEWELVLPAGRSNFEPGVYDFTFAASDLSGASDEAGPYPIEFAKEILNTGVTINEIRTPDLCVKSSNGASDGRLFSTTAVEFDVTGALPSDGGRIGWPDLEDGEDATGVQEDDGSITFTAEIPADTVFTQEKVNIVAQVTRVEDGELANEVISTSVERVSSENDCNS